MPDRDEAEQEAIEQQYAQHGHERQLKAYVPKAHGVSRKHDDGSQRQRVERGPAPAKHYAHGKNGKHGRRPDDTCPHANDERVRPDGGKNQGLAQPFPAATQGQQQRQNGIDDA